MNGIDGPLVLAGRTAAAQRACPGGQTIWPDVPGLRTWGRFANGELRTETHRLGRVVLLGHCLATHDELHTALEAALLHGRPEALTRLRGGYTALLLTRDRLLAFTDIATRFPLYYRPAGGDTLLSSRLGPITRGAVDPLVAAAQIVGLSSDDLLPGRSSFTDVHYVSAARAVEITDAGVREWTYPYLDDGEPLSLEEGGLLLRAEMDGAARKRMHLAEHPTGDITGGYDSTASAYRASRHGELHVFTCHNPVADAGDIGPAREITKANSALVHHEIESDENTLPFAGLPTACVCDQPSRVVIMSGDLRMRTAALVEAGSDMHMTGDGGDALFTPSSAYLASLVGVHKFGRLWRDATGFARRRDVAPLAVLREAVGLARGGFQRVLADLRADLTDGYGGSSTVGGVDGWRLLAPAGTWLTGRVRRDLADALSPRSAEELKLTQIGVADRIALTQLRRAGRGLREWSELTDGAVPLHAPYLDGPVIRAVLRTPGHERARSHKALLCKAMADDERWRPSPGSGDYSKELYLGFQNARAMLLGLLKSPRLADLGVIEPIPVRSAIQDVGRGLAYPPGLTEIVAWELWLRGLS